ncbi:hypothetical protein BDZ94DRAFT_1318043 [Collybia nuda]|uniref:DUF7770 domain-containing protein n=1 Tax=Collybia nuda TaxID=64659 RepID=A0A9P6CQ82_9AGAR|nr:hypothetical protein BDZ94DRAFT_1318043 [Collybia nuda]
MNHIFSAIHAVGQASSERHQANPELRSTVKFGTSMLNPAVRQMTVNSVIIHGSMDPNGRYVHWRLYLQLDSYSGTQSVELNSQKVSYDGLTALFIEHRLYMFSTRQLSVGHIPIRFSQRVTVQDIINLALTNKRDQYRLNTGGSGCRYWCQTFISDLVHARYIPRDSNDIVEQFILALHRQHGNHLIPYPLYHGTFY